MSKCKCGFDFGKQSRRLNYCPDCGAPRPADELEMTEEEWIASETRSAYGNWGTWKELSDDCREDWLRVLAKARELLTPGIRRAVLEEVRDHAAEMREAKGDGSERARGLDEAFDYFCEWAKMNLREMGKPATPTARDRTCAEAKPAESTRYSTSNVDTWIRSNHLGPQPQVDALKQAACADIAAAVKPWKERAEQAEVQLAGCGVAAMGWAKPGVVEGGDCSPGDYGWSASFGDVKKLRQAFEDGQARIADLESQLAQAKSATEANAQAARDLAELRRRKQG